MRVRLQEERDRWILWLPVPLAAGIALYFALPAEPSLSTGIFAVLLCALFLAIRRGLLPAALLLASIGFLAAEIRSQQVAAPILDKPTGIVRLQGRLVEVEPSERGTRIVLDHLTGWPVEHQHIKRIRLNLRGHPLLQPGQRLQLRAKLTPPPMPLAPGGFDFSRQAWFQQWGAVGYAIGPPQTLSIGITPTRYERWALGLRGLRQDLGRRIEGATVKVGYRPAIGMVATALITGQRGPVPAEILDGYRDAGLAHILVIAGMHLSMMAGLVLVGLRLLLAAWPWLALRYPIHKWTAAGAWIVTLAYLLISGAPVPTQRAFIMISCLLLAILLDRRAASLRAIGLAATVILLSQPEALLGASFQLSFAAVYGLIAGYEALGPRLAEWRRSEEYWWQMPLFYVAGILLTTQIAGTATAFYSLFHFNRYAVYGLLGNCLAVPLVGFWVMPCALLGFCLMPFGLDQWGWKGMAAGLDLVTRIALWVSDLPGAVVTTAALPALSLPIFSLGAAWLILWRRKWRLLGLVPMAAGIVVAVVNRPPDLLLDGGLRIAALREGDGLLHLTAGRAEPSLRGAWARIAGEEEPLPSLSLGNGLFCDDFGCMAKIGEQRKWVSLDRAKMRENGTHAVWFHDNGPATVLTVGAWQGDRPWVGKIANGRASLLP